MISARHAGSGGRHGSPSLSDFCGSSGLQGVQPVARPANMDPLSPLSSSMQQELMLS